MASRMPASTAGMYCRGMTPPLISSANSNPDPRGSGSMRTWAMPNWPCPPVCFLCLPSAAALAVMVSRNGMRRSSMSTPTLNLRSIRFRDVRRCMSPSPESSVWRVSRGRVTRSEGSSPHIRRSALESFSSSALLRGTTANDSIGSGRGGAANSVEPSPSVSPVAVSASLAAAPMSPAASSPTGSLEAPCSRNSVRTRSLLPVRELTRTVSALSAPVASLKIETVPR